MDSQQLEERLNRVWPAEALVATSAELIAAGFNERLLARSLQFRLVFRLRKGAYIRATTWRMLAPWDKDTARLRAHLLTARGDAVYSYFSAARLQGLFVWNCGPSVHVTRRATVSGTSSAHDVSAHHEPLSEEELTFQPLRTGGQVRVTTLERTVVDCARLGGFQEAVVIGDDALRHGARLEVMWAIVEAMPGRRGIRKARRVLRSLDARSESPGESRTRVIIAEMDIDQPEPQVTLSAGGAIYRPDFVWRKQKLIVEFDGDIKYFAYKRTAEVIVAERKRERRLSEEGWRFVRLEWADLANPAGVRRRILEAYNRPSWAATA